MDSMAVEFCRQWRTSSITDSVPALLLLVPVQRCAVSYRRVGRQHVVLQTHVPCEERKKEQYEAPG